MILSDLNVSEDNRFNGRRVPLELNVALNIIVPRKLTLNISDLLFSVSRNLVMIP